MQCDRCDWSGHPVHELQIGGRIMPQCPQCSNVLEASEVSAERAPQRVRKNVIALPAQGLDVLSFAKTRLQELEGKLLEMNKLQEEAAVLKRMVAAASSESTRD